MRAAHAGMNFIGQELIATIDDIVEAMKAKQVGDAEVNEVNDPGLGGRLRVSIGPLRDRSCRLEHLVVLLGFGP